MAWWVLAIGKCQKLARNVVMGLGPTPYGYRAVRNEKGKTIGLKIDPDPAAIVRRIFREAARRPLCDICHEFDREGIRSPAGGSGWAERTMCACLRYYPGLALSHGQERCTLPSVPADGLEAEAWRVVCDVLLDEQRLRDGLADARNANCVEIARPEKALAKQMVERLKADEGSTTEAVLRHVGQELES